MKSSPGYTMSLKTTHKGAPRPDHGGLTLGRLIEWSGGISSLRASARAVNIGTVWNDSRSITPGDVFVAIATDKDDGHRYVRAAMSAGAAAAIVDKKTDVDCDPADRDKLIRVSDPLLAVQRAAARYRRELGLLLIGVTGSSGKTTTRSCIAAVLATTFKVGETYTNWNNHIGVPLSLLRLGGEEWIGVMEMGANHEGEIAVLSKIARPDIALITNIGYAHLGLFGSLAATTRAKFEIADGLTKNGFLLLNGDDDRIVAQARRRELPAVFFGRSRRCGIRPENVAFDPKRGLDFILDGSPFFLPAPGRHFLYSALPAVFLGRRCGVPDETIARALAAQQPLAMRGALETKNGATFIIDCYNANPSSMKNAVTALSEMAGKKRRVAIVGDMLELGAYSKRLHAGLGTTLARSGASAVVAVGAFAGDVANGARRAGLPARRIVTAANAEDAVALARQAVRPGDFVLIKGSRGVHLETVFEKL